MLCMGSLHAQNSNFQIDSGSIDLKHLGSDSDFKGVYWSEEDLHTFSLVYDGRLNVLNSKLHFRNELLLTPSNFFTLSGNGNIGIGQDSPLERLHIGDGNIRVDNASMHFKQIGVFQNRGIFFAEAEDPVFGISYDGQGTGNNNFLKFQKYVGDTTTMISMKANGFVGIGTSDPVSTLTVNGKINIGFETANPVEGDVRYNSTISEFEGFYSDGWRSFADENAQIYTMNISSAAFRAKSYLSDDALISIRGALEIPNTVTVNDPLYFAQLPLPQGAVVIEITYNFENADPTALMEFWLNRVEDDNSVNERLSFYSSGQTAGFVRHTMSDVHFLSGINDYYFLVVQFNKPSGQADFLQKLQGVQVKYTLP